MTLWEKSYEVNQLMQKFTTGKDHLLDLKLIKHDCMASEAHAKMLCKIGILKEEELKKILGVLNEIIILNESKKFKILPEQEDCHTAIEDHLIKKLGNLGKKIHTARSRNDQVLVAIRLYEKEELQKTINLVKELIVKFEEFSKKFGSITFPGYTHTRKAMPNSIKDWVLGFQESAKDDLKILKAILDVVDKSPLGSAAGYGVPIINIDKKFVAKELGFNNYFKNNSYCQITRGKIEGLIIDVLSQVMFTLNKICNDIILFSCSHFNYLDLPKEFCTGSSIMPQKKNPDVFELIRGNYHVLLGEALKIKSMSGNLISGYHRDLQLNKEPLMNSFKIVEDCLNIVIEVFPNIKVNKESCSEALTHELFATKEAYKLVVKGIPFREAYKIIGAKYA